MDSSLRGDRELGWLLFFSMFVVLVARILHAILMKRRVLNEMTMALACLFITFDPTTRGLKQTVAVSHDVVGQFAISHRSIRSSLVDISFRFFLFVDCLCSWCTTGGFVCLQRLLSAYSWAFRASLLVSQRDHHLMLSIFCLCSRFAHLIGSRSDFNVAAVTKMISHGGEAVRGPLYSQLLSASSYYMIIMHYVVWNESNMNEESLSSCAI